MKALEEKYLEGLSELFPSIAAASTEIINLQAIVNLPKGTEHFLTDIHGEYEAFAHVLKNGSGSVKRKVDDVFANTMSSRDNQTLDQFTQGYNKFLRSSDLDNCTDDRIII